MSKVFIEESTLTNIGSAIREMTGKTDLIAPGDMPKEIRGIETAGTVEALTITENGTYTAPEGIDGYNPVTVNVPTSTGDLPEALLNVSGRCSYRYYSFDGYWTPFLQEYGSQIKTENIAQMDHMFERCTGLSELPFELNIGKGIFSMGSAESAFTSSGITKIPKINNPNNVWFTSYENMFSSTELVEVTKEDMAFIPNLVTQDVSSKAPSFNGMFSLCANLRRIEPGALKYCWSPGQSQYSGGGCIWTGGTSFSNMNALDELLELPFPDVNVPSMSNTTIRPVYRVGRLKNFTFEMNEDGTPKDTQIYGMTIELSQVSDYIGWSRSPLYGEFVGKEVTDDASYQALKNDPDWWTTKIEYSRFNHDSAVNTINSLPNCIGSSGNTIKFRGSCGSATDGGAISTLTEDEIAVATAKGWTVTIV